jgi:drug/metabolite transporter (DMT)-like permease
VPTVTVELLAMVLILVSALLHALTNVLIKISDDGLLVRAFMNAAALAVALPVIPFVPAPGKDLWPILLVAMFLHGLYPFFLVSAYRHGDLNAALPLARGTSPIVVALISYVGLGAPYNHTQAAGVILISLAIASIALERNRLHSRSRGRRGLALAVATGVIIALYTVVDGIGLRAAASPWTYIVWLFALDGLFVTTAVTLVRRDSAPAFLRRSWKPCLLAAAFGILGYGLALYALAIGNVVKIAALRETSVIFAAVIGTLFLGEPMGRKRIMAAVAVACGAVFMHFDR